MLDYLGALAGESEKFAAAAAAGSHDAAVPTCPGWTLADLVWHLSEVQHFWASIVEAQLGPDQVPELTRPDPERLVGLFGEQSSRLQRVLGATDPGAACWTWYQPDQTVGWVRRRQAHEALIHRIDAELGAGLSTPVDADLAADGIDEILRIQIDGFPDWGTFTGDGLTARLTETAGGRSWGLEYGRFTGTSPTSHTTYDLDAVRVVDPDVTTPEVAIAGPPVDLDLWLWGRGSADRLAVSGDAELVVRLRAVAAEATG